MGELLDFKGKVDFTQAKKDIADFEKFLASKKISVPSSIPNTSGLTAEKTASLALQGALQQEIKVRVDKNKLRLTEITNSQAEIDAYNNAANGSKGLTSTLNAQDIARAKVTNGLINSTQAVNENNQATKAGNLTKKQSAQLLSEEKYIQQQSTAELKNNSREQLNAKGSIEQRRAALIRLSSSYDRLSAIERATPSGQRLKNVVSGLTEQVKTLEAETGRAQRNVGNYGSAIGNGLSKVWSGLRNIAYLVPGLGLAGVIGLISEPIVKAISSLDLFKKKATEAKLASEGIATAYQSSEYSAAIKNVNELRTNIDLAKSGILSKSEVVKQYNETIGKTTGQVKSLNEAEMELSNNADAYIKFTLMKAAAQLALEGASKQAYEAALQAQKDQERLVRQVTAPVISGDKEGEALRKVLTKTLKRENDQRVKDAEDSQKKQLKIFNKFQADAAKIAKDNKFSFTSGFADKTTIKQAESELAARNKLQQQITDMINTSTIKQLSADDQEVASIREKYRKMEREIKEFNDKVKGKFKVDASGLPNAEKNEVQSILDKRQAEKDKKEQEKAKEHYEKLLSEFMDFGQKMDKAKSDFEKDDAILVNDPRQRAVRKAAYEKEVQDIVDSNGKKLDEYEKLIEGIDQLSRKEALAALNIARKALADDKGAGLVSEKVAKETEKLFDKTEKAIIKGTKAAGEELINLANQIDAVVSAVGGMDTAFGKVLSTVSNVVGQVGNIKKGMSDFETAGEQGDTLGQLGAGLGILGAGISIFKTVFSLFDRSQQREEQAAYARDLQNKQVEALNKSLERQVSLLNDAYGTDRIVKYNEAITQARDNEAKYQKQLEGRFKLTGDKTIDKYIEQLNSGQIKLGKGMTGIFLKNLVDQGGIKTLPSDIATLQTLLDEGKLDASTSKIVENLIQANKTAEELANNLRAENVGSSLSQIADDFIKTLTDGTQDFGKSFEDTIRTSILNGFKGKLIEQQLQAFYTQFADLSAGGLTQDEITALRDAYSRAAEKAKQDILDLEAATGIKLTGDTSTTPKTGISGKIIGEAVTEGTANRMLGMTQGVYDLTKQNGMTMGEMLQVGHAKLAALEKIVANTGRGADNTTGIGEKLDKIVTNTTPKPTTSDPLGQALRDAGISG